LNEEEEKKAYYQRVLEVKQGSFTPIVFTAMCGSGREAQHFYSQLS